MTATKTILCSIQKPRSGWFKQKQKQVSIANKFKEQLFILCSPDTERVLGTAQDEEAVSYYNDIYSEVCGNRGKHDTEIDILGYVRSSHDGILELPVTRAPYATLNSEMSRSATQ